jgi:AAA family ATP:ADP antiporter
MHTTTWKLDSTQIYGVLPAATIFIALYSKMATIFDKKTLFYVTCIPFFTFFFLFDAVIYPNRNVIQPSLRQVLSILQISSSTSGAKMIFAKIVENWTSALFYIVAEVYSSVSVGILFWQHANDVVSVSQAKRFYPLFAQMSGLAPILAGQYVVRYASRAKDFGESLHRLTWLVTFSGVMICSFYKWSNDYIEMTTESSNLEDGEKMQKKKKTKMSMSESARFLASSEYLRLIAVLVVGYGLSINFTDVTWKSIVKKQYPDALEYQRFMGNFSSLVGFSTCIVIFLGVHAIRILGWRTGALATPLVMSLLGLPFFSSILVGLDSPGTLRTAVVFGAIQTLLSKTAKYSLFDPTTQMAYIPLDDESKVKGKAAIEVLGSRLGKSGGSFIQQLLVLAFGSILKACPAIMVLYFLVLTWWAYSANRLGTLFLAKTALQEDSKEHQN